MDPIEAKLILETNQSDPKGRVRPGIPREETLLQVQLGRIDRQTFQVVRPCADTGPSSPG